MRSSMQHSLETGQTDGLQSQPHRHLHDTQSNESVLSGRFIEGKSVKELRTVLFLSRRQIERRMNDALAEFQIKLNDLIEHGDLPWPA